MTSKIKYNYMIYARPKREEYRWDRTAVFQGVEFTDLSEVYQRIQELRKDKDRFPYEVVYEVDEIKTTVTVTETRRTLSSKQLKSLSSRSKL